MKNSVSIIRKSYSIIAAVMLSMGLTSCEVLMEVAQGMASYQTYNYGLSAGYGSGYSSGYASTSSSTTSSYSSSPKTCSRCRGTGNCQTCGGCGKKYDYGTMSITTHKKYVQRCGVCNGTGHCGVCDGKGSI